MITLLEELAMNAWPSLQTMVYDGWLLRFAEGYTRRANSVHPLYRSTLALGEKLEACEALYRARQQPVVFKMTPAACPAELDAALAERGYRSEAATSVQLMDLEKVDVELAEGVVLREQFSVNWFEAFSRMNALDTARTATLERILKAIVPRHCFAAILYKRQIIACGLGVLQGNYLGLFDILTDSDHRCQGYGRQVVESLLAWGKSCGARRSYLQVMHDNAPALHLYARQGYVEQYTYWYRVN